MSAARACCRAEIFGGGFPRPGRGNARSSTERTRIRSAPCKPLPEVTVHVPPEVLVETTDSQYDVPRVGDPEWCSHIAPSHEKVPLDSAWTACWPQLHSPSSRCHMMSYSNINISDFPGIEPHFQDNPSYTHPRSLCRLSCPQMRAGCRRYERGWAGRIMGRHNMDTGVGA